MANTKTTFIATAPDGTQIKRTSTTRTYSHAVICWGIGYGETEPSWGQLSFNAREELALREVKRWMGHFEKVIVVPVTVAA